MMEKQLTQGKQCNYQVTFTFTDAEKAGVKNHVLDHFAQDIHILGFRAGKVALHMVESKVQPDYVQMAINKHMVYKGSKELLGENKDLMIIGELDALDTT